MLELSCNRAEPFELEGGELRAFLEDGDSLTISGWCQGDGYRIGLGEVEGIVLESVA